MSAPDTRAQFEDAVRQLEREPEKAIEILTQLANGKSPEAGPAACKLGLAFLTDGKPQSEVMEWFKRSADLGDPEGMRQLAISCEESGDQLTALRLYTQSTQLGNPQSAILWWLALKEQHPNDECAISEDLSRIGGVFYRSTLSNKARSAFVNLALEHAFQLNPKNSTRLGYFLHQAFKMAAGEQPSTQPDAISTPAGAQGEQTPPSLTP